MDHYGQHVECESCLVNTAGVGEYDTDKCIVKGCPYCLDMNTTQEYEPGPLHAEALDDIAFDRARREAARLRDYDDGIIWDDDH